VTIKKAFIHTYAWVLLVPCFIGGILVYATIDTTVYTTSELVVIPGVVETTSWTGLESVLVQDVGEYALYQEFTAGNAAYPVVASEQVGEEEETASTTGQGGTQGGDSASGDEAPSVSDESSGEGDSTVVPDADAQPDTDSNTDEPAAAEPTPEVEEIEVPPTPEPEVPAEPAAEPEPQAVRSSDTQLVWGVFPQSAGVYPHAQEISEVPTVPDSGPNELINESEAEEPSVTSDVNTGGTENVPTEPLDVVVGDEGGVPSTDQTVNEPSEGQTVEGGVVTETESSGSPVDVETVPGEDTALLSGAEAILGDGEAYATIPACEEAMGCKKYPISFSGFTLPDFDTASVLDNAQLRLSLSAKKNASADYAGPQRFAVEYRYGSTSEYKVASIIDVEDEVSNGINGGYYLISFETPPKLAELSKLEVRVVFEGNLESMEAAYVESIWLEVTAGQFYEDVTLATTSDAVTYSRDLAVPKFHELYNPDIDQSVNSLPAFTLGYSPQENFFKRIFNAVFFENHYNVEQLRLTDSDGQVIDVPIQVVYQNDTTWTLQFKKQPQKLVAGKYTLEVMVNENDVVYTDSFQFYWGVLAVNTTKSRYFPNEPVRLQLAALTDQGDTICDANLALKIIDPKNNIFEVPVTQTGACGPNNVTDRPDYVADFIETSEWGEYTVQLQHFNASGEMVHSIQDTFEVADYIPFDIERTAPTRIFPPAPYDVAIKVTAYRDFTGDITERVPRGFVVEGLQGATIESLPEYSQITWSDVTMKEGESITLTYRFDAPDVSPYLYLLGPLNMDGFTERRQWQIASDALNNIGWFEGTRTIAGTNLNTFLESPLQWSTSTIDSYYFAHATSADSHKVTLRQDGDYFISVTLPHQRVDTNNTRTRIGVEVKKNGEVVQEGIGRSAFILQGGVTHTESSSHVNFLLTDVTANDYIEVYTRDLTPYSAADNVVVTEQAAMYVEYIPPSAPVFAGTATSTVASTSLNTTASPLTWTETRQDIGAYSHSNTVNPQNITLVATGTYMVHVNIPFEATQRDTNIMGRVLLDGVQVPGGLFSQGYIIGVGGGTEGDHQSSIHWSGVVTSTSTNQVLTITTEQEAAAGTSSIARGYTASIYVEPFPVDDTIVLRGNTVTGGAPTNWNPATAESVQWTTAVQGDAVTYSHSTTSSSSLITINEGGDYLLTYTDNLTEANATPNPRITVEVNGIAVPGAQSKTHIIRNLLGHNNSSAVLVYLLEGVSASSTVRVRVQQEAEIDLVNDAAIALLTLTKKVALNERAAAPSMFNAPFDNIRTASTSPYFDFQSNDPDGSSDIQYEFAISTSSDFATATIRTSGVDAGFINTASSTDTSPFIENNRIRFQLQPGDSLTDLTTYYWRVRAKDVTGSGGFGEWSTTQSYTVNLAATVPNWYQTFTGQFSTDTLVGALSTGQDNVQVDAGVNTEMMIAYGDGTNATPRYRLWEGTAWSDPQLSALPVGGTINWVRTAAGVTRDEYILLTLDQSTSTYAQVFSSSSAWGNQVLLSSRVNNRNHRGIALGYESLSGDAMAVSCDNGPSPVYRIWNGSSWSATSSITVSSLNNCSFLEIASDPASDEMILVVRDSGASVGNNYEALVWDGSAWVANRVIGSVQAGQLDRSGIGLAYEASGNQAVIAVTDTTQPRIAYTTWDGTSFTTNTTQLLGNDFEFGRLVADTDTDDMALCYVDEAAGGDQADIGVLTWNGTSWQTYQEVDQVGNGQTGRPVDCEFETTAGRGDNLLIAYSDTVNARYAVYSGSWPVTEQTITGIEDSFWVQTERAGDGTIVMVSHDDAVAGDEIESSYWNGTSWSTKQSVVPNPSSVIGVPFETYDMAAKRFQFSEGIVTTQPITFSFVPGRSTWGDLSFSTSEPFGTDVRVRLKYSSSTVCDTYIPNGALSGNAAGFDVASSTLNISGLSTTTYSQICLEATITTLGSESASLDDWSVTWLREPKLIQNNYRWYDNGSFLTPTDPWPGGVPDVLLNTPLAASEAVNINDVIRLRMTLQGSNVNLASSTEVFKLQYAPGQVCSPSLAWADVGSPASTTAVWRGYENSIVGSDWLSASWLRRMKITVNSAMASGTITDFPVYVNLDDLPDTFFANVQSDGDDIRVTTSDGLSEVPFELVSINTGTKVGELHFKAPSISTTTNTDFYIYYGNPSASPYASTATYGRNNVWSNNYEVVYHLDTNPASTIVDSTRNGRNLTSSGSMNSSDVIAGAVGNGIDFDGVDDRLTNAGYTWPNASNTVTVTAWNNVVSVPTPLAANLFAFQLSGTERFATHAPWNDSIIYWDFGTCCGGAGRVSVSYASFLNKWSHIGLVSGGLSGTMGVYLDGTVRVSGAADDPNVNLSNFSLGSNGAGAYHRGRIDEFRIASVARSSGWIRTEHNNQSNPTGFYSLSAEERVGDGQRIPSTVLTGSDYAESYEENNPTATNTNLIAIGNDAEWDFVLQNYAGAPDTEYCFRMVYDDGSTLNTYARYPRLITNSPPPPPTLVAPFDNEQAASTTPWFEFFTDDALSDDVSYQVQIDNNYDFTSVTIDRESNANFGQFTNLSAPSERGLFTTGNIIQFIPNTTVSSGTYYWRVRAKDDNGSGAYGEWSTPFSFTVASTSITTWYQTFGEQFSTNNLLDAVVSTSTHDIGILTGFTNATITSTAIDYDDKDTGNAWGEFSFNHNVTSGSIRYYFEYNTGADVWDLIPNSALSGNAAGFTSSPVSLIGLDTDVYNEIRVMAVFSGTASLPRLLDWKVEWGETIDIPTLIQPFDNAKVSATAPELTFFTTDPQGDDLQYEVQISTTYDFAASSTYVSGVDAGFVNVTNGANLSPFDSGNTIRYTVQSALSNGQTYWWRVRARDPDDTGIWSNYNDPQSFTVDTAVQTATWFQTVGDQFATDDLVNIETTSGGAQITSVISGVMAVYGEGIVQVPQYRLWNGATWSSPEPAESVDAQIRWTRLAANPTRAEYALGTLGTDLDVNFQVYSGATESWGNLFELYTESTESTKRRFDLAYETDSGDLVTVACAGTDATYSVWNGTSWSATSSINLANTNDCEWVQMSSDPTSDEIIAVFRHTNASSTSFEAQVWDGSSWGDSLVAGTISNNAYEGMAVNYEASGNQALVTVANNTSNNFLWSAWNGSFWTTATTTPILNDFFWGSLKRDEGTDRLVLCAVDAGSGGGSDAGLILWNGSSWGTYTSVDVNHNDVAGPGIDCEFETVAGRTGNIVIPYSDGTLTRYKTYNIASTSLTTIASLSTMNDGFYVRTVRGGDGIVHAYTLDDASTPDRYDTSRWDGTLWSSLNNFSTNPSITSAPFNGSIAMAAQVFPNFTDGTIRSKPIEFASGNSPRWERIRWNDTTPGASDIRYRVYFETATGSYALVPDSALSGNAAGFTNSPVSISTLDRTIYDTLKLEAELICSSGNCPSVQDWSVEWSQGITVSGSALQFDQLTAVSTGTIAVAVNGVLQVGKTATLGSGTTTTQVVFDTAGTSTFTVPSGVTNITVKAWGAGGGAGGGGTSDAGGAGGGGGFVQGNLTVIPTEELAIRIGGGGAGGSLGLPPGAGGGGGYSGLFRSSTPLAIAGGGGGGGGGTGGIRFVAAGAACAVEATSCSPGIPAGTVSDDVYILVLHSRTDTAHACTTNCAGWTEFSTQAGSGTEGRLSVWWYRQSGAAPAAPTFAGPATAAYTGRIWAYRGVATSGNPYDVLGTNTAVTPATTTYSGSNLTSTVPDAMVVHVAGTMDDNTWGPASGSCTFPTTVNTSFYTANNPAGADNSISLCYRENPLGAAGSLGIPSNLQAGNGPDLGRYFTFALRPNSTGILAAGRGGAGGGLVGEAGVNASTTTGGGGGTQSAGGAAGGGTGTNGAAYSGGNGSGGTGGGAGGAGGVNGGGSGGTGNLGTIAAAGGGGGAGYYGGGGANSASGPYIPGAGGGGGSSFIETGATATSTQSGTSSAPGNSGDGDYAAGVGVGNTSATSSNGALGGAGRVVISYSVTNSPGAWSIPNVSAFAGDVITVFMQGASGTAEAVGVTKYDGVGDISGMQLSERHLTIGSQDNPTVSNANLGLYDSSDTEDVFFSVTGASALNLCVEGTCGDARLRVLASSTYAPGASGSVINFQNNGTFAPATNTLRVSGAWLQNATFTPDTSTIIFTATTSSTTLQNATSTYIFHNVTFGETSGSATWNLTKPLDITGTLAVDFGTLARGTSSINLEQNLRIGTGGFMTGMGTTTFDGSGSHTWTDTTASSTNVGRVVIDGTSKTVTLGGNVRAETVTIGADDTLNASGSGFNINVVSGWTNNNAFIPQSGTVTFVGTSTTGVINRGASSFNNLTFTGSGSSWSFSTSTLALNGSLTIATGSVTLPTGTTTIGGSFTNSGGTFLHNNGEVRMTSTAGGRTITQRADVFNNAFYDLVFSGSGAWSYTESAATTTRNMNILSGTVTLASSTLTVGGDFSVSGAGAFLHNNGELVLLVQGSNILRTNGSSLNNLRTRGIAGVAWYNNSWSNRVRLTVQSSQVPATVTDFPVYVNLAHLPDAFFSGVKTDGGDIRMTTSDGSTEVPVEVVSINTVAKTGELHFRAPTLSSTTNTSFYVYYGNSAVATNTATSTFGRANVWSNGYEAVYHLQTNPTATMVDSTRFARNLTPGAGMVSGNSVAGVIGNGVDFEGGANDNLTNAGFAWPNATNTVTVTAWNNVAFAERRNSNLFGFNETSSQRLASHAPWVDSVIYWDFGPAAVPGRVQTSYLAYHDKWTHIGLTSQGAGSTTMAIYLDGSLAVSGSPSDPSATLTGFFLGSGTGGLHNGQVDEFRIASVVRSGGWIAAERNNQASSTIFYATSTPEQRQSRTFTDTNATILGNFVLESGGDAVFPSGTLSVGGSFDNDALFTANNGTVRFNSTAGAETIAVGTTSNFATLEFNSATGDFIVTESATATVAINLTSASQFTLSSGRTLSALGTFTNAAASSSTTWTGSVLALGNGSSSTLNVKTHGGDNYGTLRAASSTLVRMWNSSADTYETVGTTSAIYSQDHAGADGDLNIYGNYVRTTGTEFWSFATDFDGAALTASTSRQVDVRVASSSSVGLTSASLNLVGTTTASTTINAITGTFGLSATNTTITAEHFTMAGMNAAGLALRASTTLSTFRDGFFTVVPGQTGITISSTTVAQNPSAQFFRIGFATSSAGAGSNVTLVGTTSQFVWFRTGSGNLYGEAYDASDANPGSIRFDDSSNSIIVSGIVYADDGVTALGAPTCNGSTLNVRIVVDGGTYSSSTSCAAGTGAYSFPAVNFIGDPKVIVYLDTNGGVQGSVVTKTPTANITNMHIYANRVITRHQDVLPLTAADMATFDSDNDTDIRFNATTSSLTVLPGTELFVFATTSFAPGGNVTLLGNASSTNFEGTLQIGNNATFTAQGTETHTLAGRLVLRSGGVFTPASSTVIFNATTSGKSITSSSTVTFNDVQFTGVGGTWNIGANLLVNGSMQVATGTVTGTGSITLPNGSLTGNGTLSLGGGTVSIAQSTTLGGTRPWTFHSLTLGNGSVVGTTTPAGTATTTVSRTLTISNAHFLDANDSLWDLTGSSTVLVETGTLLEDTSTFRYSGAGANVTATNYYNLVLQAVVGSSTYTGLGSGSIIYNDLTVGGLASTTFTLTTSDPLYEVRGNVLVQPNATLIASDSNTLTVIGNWTNNGSFVGSGGTVRFTGTSTTNIAAGLSSFSNVLINGTGTFAITQNATATGAFTLQNHSSFTVNPGQTLAVGGQFTNTLGGGATTWTSSTLALFGTGTYSINASTTSDVYGTLAVRAGTQVRMWNSSSTVYSVNSAGSLYSQDHAGVDGELYIYGNMTRSSGNDYWSFDTDFDGTLLSTSTSRQARVYFASSSGAFYSGGSLSVIGSSSASTTLQNQGVGTYGVHISGTASTQWDTVVVRDVNASGIVISGTPTVTDFSRTDHLVKINNATAITVGGTVINQNPSKNFNQNIFAADVGVTGASNVTATGTATAAWRFANHSGNLAASTTGEDFDVDPGGDPGYLVWDDSANLITVAGNVYQQDGVTVSAVCDGVDDSVRLVVAAIDTYDVVCQAGTGAFTIPNVAFNDNDTLTLYLNDETPKAATVSVDPISSISNLHLYENHVIVRHEGADPITIDDIAVWDSSDDPTDIPFTAVSGAPDTLSLPADRKLLVWTGKTFEPNGNVTVSGGGGGSVYDGTLEAQSSATFRAKGTETHTVGGSLIFGTSAVFTGAQSTLVFTTSGSGRTVDVNSGSFGSTTFSGSGSWTITDPLFTLGGSFAQSAGTVTFPSGTTTVGRAFNATGGSFTINNSPLVFTATTTGNTVRFDDSLVTSLTFSGVGGGWNMTDTNATVTASVIKTAGTLTLPSGNLAVGGSFENRGGTLAHNTSDLIMTSTSSAVVRASSSDLFAVRFTGVGPFTLADTNVTFLDDFAVNAGSVAIGTGTLAVGGSFTATGGTFSHASGTVLLNASAIGKTISPGNSSFYNLQIGAPSGGYTMSSATTTNNFTIASVNSFTATTGATVRVGGVFTNSVGGAATTWTGSTLVLQSGTSYSLNTRSNTGDTYGTLQIGANTDIRSWYSAAATTTVATSGSLYSQDNNNVNGHLYIYGDLVFSTSTEYWNYATDFDGTALTGVERKVSVFLATGATTTLQSGTLQLLGASGNVTSVEGLSSSSTYAFIVSGGTFNANYYSFADLTIDGLQFIGTPTITELSNGLFDVTVNTTSLITLSSTTLNANPSKLFDAIGFTASGSLTGFNIELVGDTSNAWRFTNTYGNIDGEAFDIDGVDACGSLRWPDSSCLLTEQTHVRWRNDDGLEGAPDSEWYDADWDYRKRVRFVNENATAATSSTALKMTVTYDSDMQTDFDDLRFTDDDGTTLLSHWVEKYTPSTNAVVWVEVPSVAALDTTTVFMYYGNSSSTSISSGTSTFSVIDDFEDNSISEYSGDTSLFQVDTSPVYGGTYALEPSNTLGRTNTDGLYRTDQTVSRGQVLRWMQYVNVTAPEDDACTVFGVQTPGSTNQNYAVCLQRFGVDRMLLARNVTDNDSSGTVLASTTVSYATGWYEVEVDWQTNNTITASLYTEAGTPVASTTASDSNYSSGGFGFGYWINKGAWDSFTARTRGAGRPAVYFGAEQTAGGASWASTLDGAGNGFVPGDTARLRIAIENSGLDITNQQFRLEYAAKGVAPTCESVNTSNFVTVPNQATCGSSPVCMATSTFVGDGDATTDLLFGTNGTFTSGEVTESPSNQAAALDVNQDFYTELEYVLTPTLNAVDAYCFRVSNAGTPLDFYNKVAELGLRFDPSVSAATLNGGQNISLTPGTTTVVIATSSVFDFNGYTDLAHATATFYRTSVGASCTPDNNSCYRMSTEAGNCSFTNCSGSSCVLSCSANVFFHADPTDFGTYSGQEWFAFLEAEDVGGGFGFNSSPGVELGTMRAITVDSLINYGALEALGDTGSVNPTTTVTNLGNVEIDIEVEGTDLTDGLSSTIPATQQKFSTSTFTYSGCISCAQISSSSPVEAGLLLTKPANITPPVAADVYWGIAVPFGISSTPHSGTNLFTPISP
jgi:hypothetical protein